jgi:hypothetical protein
LVDDDLYDDDLYLDDHYNDADTLKLEDLYANANGINMPVNGPNGYFDMYHQINPYSEQHHVPEYHDQDDIWREAEMYSNDLNRDW